MVAAKDFSVKKNFDVKLVTATTMCFYHRADVLYCTRWIFWYLCIFTAALLSTNFTEAEVFTIGYLTNIHGRENPHRQGLVISGAISYALDVVNSNSSILKGHKLRMIYNDTEGDTLIGTNVTIQQWRQGAIAFFGPEDTCEVEATVAASLNLPMISYVSTLFFSLLSNLESFS